MNKIFLRPIIIIEDSNEDFELMKRLFIQVGITNPLIRFTNGDDARDFFFKEGKYEETELDLPPFLIFMDLNVPLTDGWTLLTEIKADERLRAIPIVVLSNMLDPREISLCYHKGANSFMPKTVGYKESLERFKAFKSYWWETMIMPYCSTIEGIS